MAILGHLRCFIADLILLRFTLLLSKFLGQKPRLRSFFLDKYHVWHGLDRRPTLHRTYRRLARYPGQIETQNHIRMHTPSVAPTGDLEEATPPSPALISSPQDGRGYQKGPREGLDTDPPNHRKAAVGITVGINHQSSCHRFSLTLCINIIYVTTQYKRQTASVGERWNSISCQLFAERQMIRSRSTQRRRQRRCLDFLAAHCRQRGEPGGEALNWVENFILPS